MMSMGGRQEERSMRGAGAHQFTAGEYSSLHARFSRDNTMSRAGREEGRYPRRKYFS
jgi:hypothetical protein